VPADLRGVAAFVPRQAGVVAGLGVALAVLDVVLGDDLDVRLVGRTGSARCRASRCSRSRGPVAACSPPSAPR
jgi:nicotinate-nucleotide pyrophosphorylase